MIRLALSAAGPWAADVVTDRYRLESETRTRGRTGLRTAPTDRMSAFPRFVPLVLVPYSKYQFACARRQSRWIPPASVNGDCPSGTRAPVHSAHSNRPGPSVKPADIQLDFRISPRAAELRRQCAIPGAIEPPPRARPNGALVRTRHRRRPGPCGARPCLFEG